MGVKPYETMHVTSNLDAAIALARALYDTEDRMSALALIAMDGPCGIVNESRHQCFLALNDAAHRIGFDLFPIEDIDGSKHWVEIWNSKRGEAVGVWDGREWIKF